MNKQIDLYELTSVLKKDFKKLLIISFVFALIGFTLSNYLNSDEYSAATSLIVGEERNVETGELNPETFEPIFEKKIIYDDNVSLSNRKIDFYTDLLKSRDVLDKVIHNNNLNISLKDMKESVFLKNKDESSIIELEIRNKNLRNADAIINDLSEEFIDTVFEVTNTKNIKVMNRAENVTVENTQNVVRNTIIATVLGFIIGTFIILLIDFFDNKVFNKKDLNKLGLEVLLEINPDSNSLDEELKLLYTKLQNYKRYEDKKNILLLPLNNEINNISIKLASIISKNDKKVLLLDADLRNPTIHKELNLPNESGILNILEKKSDVDSSIQVHNDKRNINILTSGETKKDITDLLFLNDMKNIIDNLSEKYDYLISDTHQIDGVTDGLIMSIISDGVILVVNRNEDSISHVNSILKQLEQLEVEVLGAILK